MFGSVSIGDQVVPGLLFTFCHVTDWLSSIRFHKYAPSTKSEIVTVSDTGALNVYGATSGESVAVAVSATGALNVDGATRGESVAVAVSAKAAEKSAKLKTASVAVAVSARAA